MIETDSCSGTTTVNAYAQAGAIASAVSTTLFSLCIPLPWCIAGTVVSAAIGAVDQALAISFYVLARDPSDPNYTVTAQPEIPALPSVAPQPDLTAAQA